MTDKAGWTQSEDFDWDDVPDKPPGTPDEGLYLAKITSAVAEATKKESKPAVKLELELVAPYGGGELPYVAKSIRYESLVLSKNAAFRVKQAAKACSVKPPANSGFEAVSAFAEALVGQQCIIRVRHSKSNKNDTVYAAVGAYMTEKQAAEAQSGSKGGGGSGSGAQTSRRQRQSRKAS